jgi:methylmalonyl-CoA/ethylmalonyl-CoA epimerase
VKVEGFNHVGILVEDFEPIRRVFGDLLGAKVGEPEPEPRLGVEMLWVHLDGVALEFIRPLDPDSGAAQAIRDGRVGVDHVAFTVDDVGAALVEARAAGIATQDEVPRVGAHGSSIGFLDAESVGKTRVEFVQPNPQH